jgi:hypothetical protein
MAELEKRAPVAQKSIVNFGLAVERWCWLTLSFEIGKGLYGLGKPREEYERRAAVSRSRYRAMIEAEAAHAGVNPKLVLGWSRQTACTEIRLRVWRQLRDEGCSLPVIARAAGRHHSTILYGLRRLDFGPNYWRRGMHKPWIKPKQEAPLPNAVGNSVSNATGSG